MKTKLHLLLIVLLALSVNTWGQVWESVPSGTTFRIYDINFPEGQSDIGYAACMDGADDNPGKLLKTTDNGLTWTTILPVSGDMDGLEAVFFTSVDTGFIGGWNDYFAKTTDGGVTWTQLTLSTTGKQFRDIKFWDAENGVALCRTPHTWDAFVYVTADGGDTWTLATGITHGFASLAYSDANTLFAVGAPDAEISKSTDGGLTWALNHTGLPAQFLLGVDFAGDYGVAVGSMGDIYYTTDQGVNWTRESLQSGINYEGIFVFNSDSTIFGGMNEEMYKTLDGGTIWFPEYDGAGSNNFYTIFFTDNNTGFAGGSGGLILRKEGPLSADFYAENTTTCAGSSLQFYDTSTGADSWLWTFEGGTPSTSTEQNPEVIYNTPGFYDVTLVVSSSDGSETETKLNYINVIETPWQAGTPEGETNLCTSQSYTYSIEEVLYSQEYEWEITPAAAGTIIGTGNEIELEVSESWTGDFTISVRATNICGDGGWSDDLMGTVYNSPEPYDLIGGGEICEGDPGLEIELMDSEASVDYELYKNEVPTGNIVAGTGESISFGLFTEAGNYTAIGFTDYCTTVQFGEASIIVSLLPIQLTMPVGTTEVCNNDENDYTTTGAQDTDNIIWSLIPENAGEISTDGMTATIMWDNAYEGTASLTVLAENSCGTGPTSEALEIIVYATPSPEVSGDDLVCKQEVSIYSTNENEGNTYGWEVIGGNITAGEGTSEITVTWGNTPGQAYVILNESLELGCSAIDTLAVTIDDCIGIATNILSNDFKVYPNPASSNLNLEFTTKKGEKIELSIFNSLGQLVMQKQEVASGEKQTSNFNIESLPRGIYVIKAKTSEQTIWQSKFDKF